MDNLDRLRELFDNDVYATQTTGAYIEEASKGHSVCSLEITPKLLNANGSVMGGALFTLADFAFAVASNYERMNTVSVSSQISYFTTARGNKLFAKADCLRSGKHICYYGVDIYDDTERKVAAVTITGYITD